jgi:two-component system, cell cycle response regulator
VKQPPHEAPDTPTPIDIDDSDTTRVSSRTRSLEAPKEASLVQIYGPNLGQRYILDRPLITVGRGEGNDIILDNDNVSRNHGRFSTQDGAVRYEDRGSTNGTLLNDAEITDVVLRPGDMLKIGSVMLKFITGGSAEALYHEEIYRLTIHDGLTNVPNRRYFEDFLEREHARAVRYARPLSLMLFDIDHFKHINDKYGHLAGDYVLRRLAGEVATMIRREELLARYGGEEFVVVMPETALEKAAQFAEKIRGTIERMEFTFDDQRIEVTTSVGVTVLAAGSNREQFVQAADSALYRAKQGGRNQVCTSAP